MKRLFDFSFSFIIVCCLVIPFLILCVLYKFKSDGPLIHWSRRIGENGNEFFMPKIRTMKIGAPNVATHLLKNPNLFFTKRGAFLRKYSLDELPQVWSILVGKMSFVGPRPALFNQYDLINLRAKIGIDKLKPGLTGWAQVNGRDSLSLTEKVGFDMEYLNKKSFIFDLKILFLSAIKSFASYDVSH